MDTALLDYIDTEVGTAANEEMIDFDDLVDIEIDPNQNSNYLKLNIDHLEKISSVHIKVNIVLQVLGILLLVLVYFVTSLI